MTTINLENDLEMSKILMIFASNNNMTASSTSMCPLDQCARNTNVAKETGIFTDVQQRQKSKCSITATNESWRHYRPWDQYLKAENIDIIYKCNLTEFDWRHWVIVFIKREWCGLMSLSVHKAWCVQLYFKYPLII